MCDMRPSSPVTWDQGPISTLHVTGPLSAQDGASAIEVRTRIETADPTCNELAKEVNEDETQGHYDRRRRCAQPRQLAAGGRPEDALAQHRAAACAGRRSGGRNVDRPRHHDPRYR